MKDARTMRKSECTLWTLLLFAVLAAGATVVSLARNQSASAANSGIYQQLDLFGEAIVRLANDPDRRTSMGRAARCRVGDLYSVERLVEDLQSLYMSKLREKRA